MRWSGLRVALYCIVREVLGYIRAWEVSSYAMGGISLWHGRCLLTRVVHLWKVSAYCSPLMRAVSAYGRCQLMLKGGVRLRYGMGGITLWYRRCHFMVENPKNCPAKLRQAWKGRSLSLRYALVRSSCSCTKVLAIVYPFFAGIHY